MRVASVLASVIIAHWALSFDWDIPIVMYYIKLDKELKMFDK